MPHEMKTEYTRTNESIKTEMKLRRTRGFQCLDAHSLFQQPTNYLGLSGIKIFVWLVALTLDTQARSGIIGQTHRKTHHAVLSDLLPNLSTSLQMLICLT